MKTNLMVLVSIFSISFNFTVSAQVSEQWVARYNSYKNYYDIPKDFSLDSAGNVYVTGYSQNDDGKEIITIKYNGSGVEQWVSRYGTLTSVNTYGVSIAADPKNNIYVAAIIGDTVSGFSSDIAILKYNSEGNLVWISRSTGSDQMAVSIDVDNQGNVYVCGTSGSLGDLDYITIKYNSLGTRQWFTTYDGPLHGDDYITSMDVDATGNVYVTGYSDSGLADFDYLTIKYNSSGNQQWVARYNGTGSDDDKAHSISVDNSGNVYVTGQSIGLGTYDDFATLKYNSSGVLQWVARYDSPAHDGDGGNAVGIDNIGNVIVTGTSRNLASSYDFVTIKYNSFGSQEWLALYKGGSNSVNFSKCLAIDASGNIYISGDSWENIYGFDFLTIKYDPLGNQTWSIRYEGPNSIDKVSGLALDSYGNVYITGESYIDYQTGSGYDFATVKYSQQVGIEPISTIIASSYSISQNYPNPFNPTTNINFTVPKSGFVKMIVYDINGREISSLVNQEMTPGTYKVDFDGRNLSSGIYYYTLSSGEFVETKKMMLVK